MLYPAKRRYKRLRRIHRDPLNVHVLEGCSFRVEPQPQRTKRAGSVDPLGHSAVLSDELLDPVATAASYELRDSGRVGETRPIEGSPALVVMVVAGQRDIHTMLREQRPDVVHAWRVSLFAYVVDRVMEEDEGADSRVCAQVLRQPLVLRRSRRRLGKLSRRVEANSISHPAMLTL